MDPDVPCVQGGFKVWSWPLIGSLGKEGTRRSSLAVGDGADIWARRDLIFLAGRHRYCARLLEFVFITMLGVEEKVNGV